MKKAVVLVSGGIDSSIVLRVMAARWLVFPLVVVYGQRHAREEQAAQAVVDWLRETPEFGDRCEPLRRVDISSVYRAGLARGGSQTDPAVAVPEGHYEDPSMAATVVPNRNMVLLAVATAVAAANECDVVAYGAHAGDRAVYADCRPVFVTAMREAIRYGNPGVTLEAPLLGMKKADVVWYGSQLGVPFALTWTCYQGGAIHCGRCGACVERREAFALAGVHDPTGYEAAP